MKNRMKIRIKCYPKLVTVTSAIAIGTITVVKHDQVYQTCGRHGTLKYSRFQNKNETKLVFGTIVYCIKNSFEIQDT